MHPQPLSCRSAQSRCPSGAPGPCPTHGLLHTVPSFPEALPPPSQAQEAEFSAKVGTSELDLIAPGTVQSFSQRCCPFSELLPEDLGKVLTAEDTCSCPCLFLVIHFSAASCPPLPQTLSPPPGTASDPGALVTPLAAFSLECARASEQEMPQPGCFLGKGRRGQV